MEPGPPVTCGPPSLGMFFPCAMKTETEVQRGELTCPLGLCGRETLSSPLLPSKPQAFLMEQGPGSSPLCPQATVTGRHEVTA